MSGVFPTTLPGIELKWTRKPVFSTKIQKSSSGRELRTSWYASPIYEFTCSVEFLRQGAISSGTFNEAGTLYSFFETQRGAWDSFQLTDPFDGTTRTCRFQEDSLELQQMGYKGFWEIKTVKLVTVR